MKVFVSWSGPRAKALAQAVRDWLPDVLQGLEMWVSMEIPVGAQWNDEIGQGLDESTYGIVCVTPENQRSQWLNYEMGALSKSVLDVRKRVSPLLLDMTETDMEGPITQFQACPIDEDGIWRLVQSVNDARPGALAKEALRRQFEKWWPDLNEKLREIQTMEPPEPVPEGRSEEDIQREILTLVRGLASAPQATAPPEPDDFLLRRVQNDILLRGVLDRLTRSPEERRYVALGQDSQNLLGSILTPEGAKWSFQFPRDGHPGQLTVWRETELPETVKQQVMKAADALGSPPIAFVVGRPETQPSPPDSDG